MSKKIVPDRSRGIIYGPVASRRFGVSLGINLSGAGKRCSFNCRYCFRGFNDRHRRRAAPENEFPDTADVLAAVAAWVQTAERPDVEDWTLAGNAEPTDHPQFPEIMAGLVKLRQRLAPQVKISVLSNGMGLVPRRNPRFASFNRGFCLADRPCLKLDSGRPSTWRRLALPADRVTLHEWLQAIDAVRPLILQTMLVQGGVDNTSPKELDALRSVYACLQPDVVYLVTLNKPPADTTLMPVAAEQLDAIQQHFARAFAKSPTRFLLPDPCSTRRNQGP